MTFHAAPRDGSLWAVIAPLAHLSQQALENRTKTRWAIATHFKSFVTEQQFRLEDGRNKEEDGERAERRTRRPRCLSLHQPPALTRKITGGEVESKLIFFHLLYMIRLVAPWLQFMLSLHYRWAFLNQRSHANLFYMQPQSCVRHSCKHPVCFAFSVQVLSNYRVALQA